MPKTPPRPNVYLAGPEVFLRNAVEAGRIKAEICARHGLEGCYPLDVELDLIGLAPERSAYAIAFANEGLIRTCDAVIANLTPFRGVGMDTGTAYEVGFARGLGKPVFGYTNHHLSLFGRAAEFNVKPLRERAGAPPTMRFEDSDGMAIEQFELAENLMIVGAINDSGGSVVQRRTERAARYTDLTAFEDCVKQAAAVLLS